MKYRFVSLMPAIFIIIALTSCEYYNLLGPVDMKSLKDSRFVLETNGISYKISSYDSNGERTDTTNINYHDTYSFKNFPPWYLKDKINGDTVSFVYFDIWDTAIAGNTYDIERKKQIKIIFKNGENIIKSIRLFVKNITLDSVYSCSRYYLNTKDEKLIFVLNDLSYSFDGSKYTAGIEGKETLTHISDFDYTYYNDSWTSYSDKGVNTTEKRIYLKDYPPEAGLETKIKFILFVK